MEPINLNSFFADKNLNAKSKTQALSDLLVSNQIKIEDMIEYAKNAKSADKGTCIEAIEYASRISAQVVSKKIFHYVCECLLDKAPRVQWESAKVIGNVASLHTTEFKYCIPNLISNSEHSGTVVRWSAAFALGEILKTKHKSVKELVPVFESIIQREEKNSIRKIYLEALKKWSI